MLLFFVTDDWLNDKEIRYDENDICRIQPTTQQYWCLYFCWLYASHWLLGSRKEFENHTRIRLCIDLTCSWWTTWICKVILMGICRCGWMRKIHFLWQLQRNRFDRSSETHSAIQKFFNSNNFKLPVIKIFERNFRFSMPFSVIPYAWSFVPHINKAGHLISYGRFFSRYLCQNMIAMSWNFCYYPILLINSLPN